MPITDPAKNNLLVGVITRTDVVKILMEDPARIPVLQKKRENVKPLMQRIPRDHHQFLVNAGNLGDSMNCKIYVVGGFVRDLLLNRPNDDIDLVVEGNGIAYADALADVRHVFLDYSQLQKYGVEKAVHHGQFLTAVVTLPSGLKIDVCTARLEYYPAPVALPVVELSSLKMDLYR